MVGRDDDAARFPPPHPLMRREGEHYEPILEHVAQDELPPGTPLAVVRRMALDAMVKSVIEGFEAADKHERETGTPAAFVCEVGGLPPEVAAWLASHLVAKKPPTDLAVRVLRLPCKRRPGTESVQVRIDPVRG